MSALNNKRNSGIVDSFFSQINKTNKNQTNYPIKQTNKPNAPISAVNNINLQQTINVQTTPKKIVRTNKNNPNSRGNQEIQQQTSSNNLLGNQNNSIKKQVAIENKYNDEGRSGSIDLSSIALVSNSFMRSTTKIIKTVDNPYNFVGLEKQKQKQSSTIVQAVKQRPKLIRNNKNAGNQSASKEVNLHTSQISERSYGQSSKKIQRKPVSNTRQIKFNKKQETSNKEQQKSRQVSPMVKEYDNSEIKKSSFQRTNIGKNKIISNKIQATIQQTSSNITTSVSIIKDNPSTISTSKSSYLKPAFEKKEQKQKPVQNVVKPTTNPYTRTKQISNTKVQMQIPEAKVQPSLQNNNITPLTNVYKPKVIRHNKIEEPQPQQQKVLAVIPNSQSKESIKEPNAIQKQKPIVNPPKNSFNNRYTKNNQNFTATNNEIKVEEQKDISLNNQNATTQPVNSRLNKIINKVQKNVEAVEEKKPVVQAIDLQKIIVSNNTVNNRLNINNTASSRVNATANNQPKAVTTLQESKVQKIKSNPVKSKQQLKQQMSQFISILNKCIKNKFQAALSKLVYNVKYQKIRKMQSSILILQIIKIQKAKQNNLMQSSFQLIKKIFGQKYILQLKNQLSYNPTSHQSFVILLMDRLYQNKMRYFFNKYSQINFYLRPKIAFIGCLQSFVNRHSNKLKVLSFETINFNAKYRYHHSLQFSNIVANCNKNKLHNAFLKIQSIPPQPTKISQQSKHIPVISENIAKRGRNAPKIQEIMPQENVQPIKNDKIQKLQKSISTINNDMKQLQKKSKIKKTKLQKQKKDASERLNVLKLHNEQLSNDISIKKFRNKDLTMRIQNLKTVIQFELKGDQQNDKDSKLHFLSNIYIENFKNQDELVLSEKVIEIYKLKIEDSNTLLNQWEAIIKNKELRNIIGAYENMITNQLKARRTLLEEQKLIKKLISSYAKEQYFWNWIHQYAKNS